MTQFRQVHEIYPEALWTHRLPKDGLLCASLSSHRYLLWSGYRHRTWLATLGQEVLCEAGREPREGLFPHTGLPTQSHPCLKDDLWLHFTGCALSPDMLCVPLSPYEEEKSAKPKEGGKCLGMQAQLLMRAPV